MEGEPPLNVAALQSGTAEEREAVFTALRESGAFFAEEEKSVLSLREHPLSLQAGGATMVPAPSAVDFSSEEFRTTDVPFDAETGLPELSLKSSHLTYYSEIEALAHELLGSNLEHAFCTSHIIRDSTGDSAVGVTAQGTKSGPIKTVHNDFTDEYDEVTRSRMTDHPSKHATYSRQQLKEARGIEFTREELDEYRLVVLNTWRPITVDPLRREPLAVCDNRTIQRSDLMEVRTGIGENADDPDDDFSLEVFMSLPNPDHQWHYVDEFTNQECLIFKTYDSDMHPFVPTMHSAINLPNQDAQPMRESVEARITCLLRRTPEEQAIYEERKAAAAPSPLDCLRQNPAVLAELRSKLSEDPTAAPQLIMGLMTSEPEIAKAIVANQGEFKALLTETKSQRGAGFLPAAEAGPMDAIRNHPKFEEVKAKILGGEKAVAVIMGMAAEAPDLAKLIMENREEFAAMMKEGAAKL